MTTNDDYMQMRLLTYAQYAKGKDKRKEEST